MMRNLLAALGEASGIRHPCQQDCRLDSTHGSLSVEQERWNPNSCPIRGIVSPIAVILRSCFGPWERFPGSLEIGSGG